MTSHLSLVRTYLPFDGDPPSAIVDELVTQLEAVGESDSDPEAKREVIEALDTLAEIMIGRRGRGDAVLRARIRALREQS